MKLIFWVTAVAMGSPGRGAWNAKRQFSPPAGDPSSSSSGSNRKSASRSVKIGSSASLEAACRGKLCGIVHETRWQGTSTSTSNGDVVPEVRPAPKHDDRFLHCACPF